MNTVSVINYTKIKSITKYLCSIMQIITILFHKCFKSLVMSDDEKILTFFNFDQNETIFKIQSFCFLSVEITPEDRKIQRIATILIHWATNNDNRFSVTF